jgi:hypothetical protein
MRTSRWALTREAVPVGRIHFNGAFATRMRGFVEVVDRGPAAGLLDRLDISPQPVAWSGSTAPPSDVPLTDCPDTLPPPGYFFPNVPADPLGPPHPAWPGHIQDFTVTDAQALPSSKDQCKNGGWKIYWVFQEPGRLRQLRSYGREERAGKKAGLAGRSSAHLDSPSRRV